jgi:hypothetical protein
MPFDHDGLVKRVAAYKHKAKVLRQIHSNKMWLIELKGTALDYGTLTASVALAFTSIMGTTKLHGLFFKGVTTVDVLDFAVNTIIMIVLLLSVMQIALRFGEKKAEAQNCVNVLTTFLTELDDVEILKNPTADECERQLERLRHRYEAITPILPSNTDADWEAAKIQLSKKNRA